ncbi:MAG: M56 family metallopeptidase [Breznakibacter sp.]
MNSINSIFPAELIETLGWTIVHSLWQASVVALALFGVLWLIRHKSAQIKYFIAFSSLIGILAWSAATFVQSYRYAVEKQQAKEKVLHDPLYVRTLLKNIDAHQKANAAPASADTSLNAIKTKAFIQKHFQLICLLWVIGMMFLMCRFMGGLLYSHRLKKSRLIPISGHWATRIDDIARSLHIKRKIKAYCSPRTRVPVTLGTFKPIVLFPVTAFTGLSPSAIEAIIAHELAHVMRNDYLFNIFQSIIEILFFYHPAVWFISAEIRAERENSCDNIAIGVTGDKLEYAKALVAVETGQTLYEPQLSMAFVQRKGTVLQRIKRLQKQMTMRTNFNEGLIAAVVIVAGLTLASFTLGNKPQETAPKTQSATVVIASVPKAKADSIKTEIELKVKKADKNDPEAKELKKVIELAYSENDTAAYAQMMAELDQAMRELDMEQMVRQVMQEVSTAMKGASVEISKAKADIDREQMKRDMEEARREIEEARREMVIQIRREMQTDSIDKATLTASVKAATAGIDIATSVIENIDVDAILNSAMDGLAIAMESLGNLQVDTTFIRERTKIDLEQQMKALEMQKQQLEKQQERLKEQIKELKKAKE